MSHRPALVIGPSNSRDLYDALHPFEKPLECGDPWPKDVRFDWYSVGGRYERDVTPHYADRLDAMIFTYPITEVLLPGGIWVEPSGIGIWAEPSWLREVALWAWFRKSALGPFGSFPATVVDLHL